MTVKRQQITFDNARPDDPDYPTTKSPRTAFNQDGKEVTVQIGDYVVNRDGDIVIATTSNAGYLSNSYSDKLNHGYFRARYIGNRDDYLEFANQSRRATKREVDRAKRYKQSCFKTTDKGQGVLL